MNFKRIFGLAAIAAAGAALFYYYAGHQAPEGQPSLVELSPANFPSFRDAFNQADGELRLVLMFSPT